MDAQIIYDDHGPNDSIGRLICDARWWYVIAPPLDHPTHPCLPPGTYALTRGMHNRVTPPQTAPYPCYHISSDEFPLEREYEIHILNKASESLGCFGPGTDRVVVDGVREVIHSATAHSQWMIAMDNENGTLTISEAV